MSVSAHPAAPQHLPGFITPPQETDFFLVLMAVLLVVGLLAVGNLFLRLHTLPERIAHKGHKLQFEIVAVLGLLALFTHMHIFWVAGLLLALIDIPNFGAPLASMAGSLEKISGNPDGNFAKAADAGDALAETLGGRSHDRDAPPSDIARSSNIALPRADSRSESVRA